MWCPCTFRHRLSRILICLFSGFFLSQDMMTGQSSIMRTAPRAYAHVKGPGLTQFFLSICPRRGLPRSSATILIDLVCVSVCVSGTSPRFTEWYLHRLQTQIPLGVLTRGFSEGPEKTSFKSGLKRFPGPCFLSLFLKKRHLENALPWKSLWQCKYSVWRCWQSSR